MDKTGSTRQKYGASKKSCEEIHSGERAESLSLTVIFMVIFSFSVSWSEDGVGLTVL